MNRKPFPRTPRDAPPVLTFTALAWLKLQYFCHCHDNEVGGFGISAVNDLLTVEDFVTVRQTVTPFSVRFDDQAVADHFDANIDRGIELARCCRIWLHTHPGASPEPSTTDEETFARVFGACDWSVMFILSRTGRTHARLSFSAGPGGQMLIPAQVAWPAWPEVVVAKHGSMDAHLTQWAQEFAANVHVEPCLPAPSVPATGEAGWQGSAPGDLDVWWNWDQDFDF